MSTRSVYPRASAPSPAGVPSPYGPFGPDSGEGRRQSATQLYDREQRHEMIAQAAYFRAKHRGFQPGHELEDWLAAETEVDTALTLGLPL